MSTTDRTDGFGPGASDIAATLRESGFVRLVAAADGDALAALGLLTDALGDADTPFQATVSPLPVEANRATDADHTVALGRPSTAADATLGVEASASRAAYEVAAALGTPDPVLACAGVVAAGGSPEGQPLADGEAAGLDRRPGIAGPTADPVDALVHSTLVHAPVSGEAGLADDLLGDVDTGRTDEATHRRVASLVALAVAGDESGTARGAEAAERFLRPYAGGPLETVGGYADVLDALARTRPGLGVALALGRGDREAALDAWREHARRAHAAVRESATGRYDGLFVARCGDGAPVGTVARLVRDFRSPEPVVLVVADGEAAATRTAGADTHLGEATREAAAAVGGTGGGSQSRARATFAADGTEFVAAFREAR
jgi:hypothetical protein